MAISYANLLGGTYWHSGADNDLLAGGNAIVDFGGTDTIKFLGQAGNIDPGDFIF